MPIRKAVGRSGARSKYRAVRTAVNGFTFASKAEARRYQDLLYLGRAGFVRNLELQPKFPISVDGAKVADYIADFRYELYEPAVRGGAWVDTIEDVKGMKTPVYRLKKKLVEAQYGITIREIR